ncbi:MAG: hypothetical protein ACXV8X_06800 [Candidatus Angelobacter sp.]
MLPYVLLNKNPGPPTAAMINMKKVALSSLFALMSLAPWHPNIPIAEMGSFPWFKLEPQGLCRDCAELPEPLR